jgi:hypothetical protein
MLVLLRCIGRAEDSSRPESGSSAGFRPLHHNEILVAVGSTTPARGEVRIASIKSFEIHELVRRPAPHIPEVLR